MTQTETSALSALGVPIALKFSSQFQWQSDEPPPLFITHIEVHDVDGTIFVMFNGLLQCTVDSISLQFERNPLYIF